LNVEKVSCGPQEDDEVAEGVLCRVEVVDSFDVEAFGRTNVLEDFPVGTCRARLVISMARSRRDTEVSLRALEQGYKKARRVQRHRVKDHQAAKPLVKFRWKYTCEVLVAFMALMESQEACALTCVCQEDCHLHECDDGSEEQLKRHAHLHCCEPTDATVMRAEYLSGLHCPE
jgi:hypothetical protein